jgi:hypothetical protein
MRRHLATKKGIPWEAAVVKIDVSLLEGAQLPLLLVLFDRIQSLLGRNLKLLPVCIHTQKKIGWGWVGA